MHTKKHLGFTGLRKLLSKRLSHLTDNRERDKVGYSIHDVFMSAYAMMYFQDSSLLEFQGRLQCAKHTNNLKTMFNVESIPKDTQMRDMDSKELEPIYDDFFRLLQRGKHPGIR